MSAKEATRRRDRAAGATAVISEISAALKELEQAALTEQGRLRLEVVVDRDPDAGTEVTVVDPGAGHLLTDWRANGRRHVEAASPHAAAHIRDRFAAYEDSEFITG